MTTSDQSAKALRALALIPTTDTDVLRAYIDENTNPIHSLGPLGDINIFVGANNAGKSRLLRRLFTMKQKEALSAGLPWITALRAAVTAAADLKATFADDNAKIDTTAHEKDAIAIAGSDVRLRKVLPGNKTWPLNRHVIDGYIHELVERPHSHADGALGLDSRAQLGFLNLLLQKRDDGSSSKAASVGIDVAAMHPKLNVFINAVDACSDAMGGFRGEVTPATYIPILRTAVTLRQNLQGQALNSDIYAFTISFHYKLEAQIEQLFTGLGLQATMRDQASAPKATRRRHQAFQVFLSSTFFGGQSVEITALAEGHISLTVGDGDERELQHVGDGISALIVLTYKVFMAEPGSWIFIEEPELHLHPGLQRVFFEVLLRNRTIVEKHLRVFFTTHSSHLLGLALHDSEHVAVFAFESSGDERNERFMVRAMQGPELRVLQDLGVENSSVFQANCSIWVEGPTDRKYLRAYLRAYCERTETSFSPIEDLHFAFFEYGGSNLAHYLFEEGPSREEIGGIEARFVANRIFLLADRDAGKDERHDRLREQQHPGFVYEVTPTIEIENLLSSRVLADVLPSWLRIPTADPRLQALREEDYANERMGTFLSRVFGTTIRATVVDKSGTLDTYYKNRLADLSAQHITWATMSTPARELTERLYRFIESHNRRSATAPRG